MAAVGEPIVDTLHALIDASIALDRWERKLKRMRGVPDDSHQRSMDRLKKFHQILGLKMENPGIGTAALAKLAKSRFNISRTAFYELKRDYSLR